MRAHGTGTILCAMAFCLISAPLHAQSDEQLRKTVLAPTINALKMARGQTNFAGIVEQVLNDYGKFVLAAAASTDNGRFIAEANRLDKQVGASSRGSGTTNLVTSGSVPRILGFAMETGAITQKVSGTSVTFQTNPAGLAQALAKGAEALGASPDDTATQNTLNFLRRFNVGLTFDAAKDKEKAFAGRYQELEQFSTQIYLYNHRDPTHPSWSTLWQTFGQNVGNGLPNVLNALAVDLSNQTGFKALKAETQKRLLAATTDAEIEMVILDHADKMAAFVSDRMSGLMLTEWAQYLRTQNKAYAAVARSQIWTFEYQLDRPPVQEAPADVANASRAIEAPDLSTFRLIWVRPFLGASDMTITGSASTFNRQNADVRDWQVAGKLDFPLNGIGGLSKSQFTVAGVYFHLRESPLGVPVTVNGVEVDRTGDIGFLQARLRVPLGDSGISVPFSITYASRTELIKDESELRGNLGFTLDVDKLIGHK